MKPSIYVAVLLPMSSVCAVAQTLSISLPDPIAAGSNFTATINLTGASPGNRAYTVSVTCQGCGSGTCTINTSNGSGNAGSCSVTFTAPTSGSTVQVDATTSNHNCSPSPCTASSSSTLPITLLAFEARPVGEYVTIRWITASEINNEQYILEKSEDGIQFKAFYSGPGAGNSDQINNYEVKDINPYPNLNYYRLKQVDVDGHYSYSSIIQVKFDRPSFSLAPNPTGGKFMIIGGQSKECTYSIINQLGQIISNHRPYIYGESVDLSDQPAGLYLIRIGDGANKQRLPILKIE